MTPVSNETWKLLNDVRRFIEREYADPAVAPDGEWLAKEARDIHDRLCTALAAGQSPEPSSSEVRVKGLGEWTFSTALNVWIATGAFWSYWAWERDGVGFWCAMQRGNGAEAAKADGGLLAAKAAAEADYRARILSTLDPTLSQPGTGEEVEALPWRERDIKRGLILFRTSSNAHGLTNVSILSEKVDALPQAAKDELAGMMLNIAKGLSPARFEALTTITGGENER